MNKEGCVSSVNLLSKEDNISLKNHSWNQILGLTAFFWFLVSFLFLLVESIKIHAPELWNEYSWSTYGRMQQISRISLIAAFFWSFFCIFFNQIARAKQYPLSNNKRSVLFYLFLNISFIISIIEFYFDNSSANFFYFSQKGFCLFSFGILLLTSLVWKSLFSVKSLPPALLFGSLAFWSLPFILTVLTSLQFTGVLQGAYGAWIYALMQHLFFSLVFIPLGISALLHQIESITECRFSPSSPLSFAFGIYTVATLFRCSDFAQSPLTFLPVWMKSVDTIATLFTAFAIVILLHSIFIHLNPHFSRVKNQLPFRFTFFASVSLGVATLLKSLFAFRTIEAWTQFTTLYQAIGNLLFFGFLMMIIFGWFYQQAPSLFNSTWASSHLIETHFWMTSLASGISISGLLISGVLQSIRQYTPDITPLSTVILIKPFLWIQSLSLVFQLAGIFMISLLFLLLLWGWRPNPDQSLFTEPTPSTH